MDCSIQQVLQQLERESRTKYTRHAAHGTSLSACGIPTTFDHGSPGRRTGAPWPKVLLWAAPFGRRSLGHVS